MLQRLIPKDFVPNIQHIAGVDNIVSDTLSILNSTPSDKYEPCTSKDQCLTNNLFEIGRVEDNEDCFHLNLVILQIEQQKELRHVNSNFSTYISDQVSGYSMQELDGVEIICYDSKIYVPQSLRRRMLDW